MQVWSTSRTRLWAAIGWQGTDLQCHQILLCVHQLGAPWSMKGDGTPQLTDNLDLDLPLLDGV